MCVVLNSLSCHAHRGIVEIGGVGGLAAAFNTMYADDAMPCLASPSTTNSIVLGPLLSLLRLMND